MLRRGYGPIRIESALRAAGIDPELAGRPGEDGAGDAERAAMRYARRRRIGPFAAAAPDPADRRRWIAAMARAGHPLDLVLRVLGGEAPEEDGGGY
jgi:regulatory protein